MTRNEANAVWIGVAIALAIALVLYLDIGGLEDQADSFLSSITGGSSSSSGTEGGILYALSNFENVASSHNNPGGVCGGFDASGNCTGPATFSSLGDGIAAAEAKINSWIAANPAITVAQFVKKWSGATGDVLADYTNSVASDLGLDPSDPISDGGPDGDDE
jgi:hypothetical protein